MKRIVEVEIPDGDTCITKKGHYCQFIEDEGGTCTLYNTDILSVRVLKKDGYTYLTFDSAYSWNKCKQCLEGANSTNG